MANTTNYNWETPDDTDLVKDGAAAIRTLGSSIDTTTKNLNPETTLGDLAYRSATANTNTRLGIGSSGQVLTVAAGVPSWATPSTFTSPLTTKGDIYTRSATADTRLPVGTNGHTLVADSATATGLKWAAPAGGASGLTLVKRDSFSNVANTGTTFDGVFTSTYKSYLMVIETIFAATGGDDLQIQFRYAGPTTQTASYFAYSTGFGPDASARSTGSNNTAQITISSATGGSATYPGVGDFVISNVGNSSQAAGMNGQFTDTDGGGFYTLGATSQTPRTYTGFLLKSSSTNITGTVAIYGLATA